MADNKTVSLDSFAGKKTFSGIDRETVSIDRYGSSENCEVVRFILDGVAYKAVEDPSDGYRSSMEDLSVTDEPVSNKFDPVPVFCKHRNRGSYSGEDDVLEIYNMQGGLILEVGTSNVGDYYPSFVCNFSAKELQKAATS